MFLKLCVKHVNLANIIVPPLIWVWIKVLFLFTLFILMFGGPSYISSLNGYKWFVTFIDDFSCTTWVYLMKEKNEVFSIFKFFTKWYALNLVQRSKLCVSTKGESIFMAVLKSFFSHMAWFTKTLCRAQESPFIGDYTVYDLINRLLTRVLGKKSPIEILLNYVFCSS